MDVKLDKWFRPEIDKTVLKELTKKSDIKGLIHVGVYFSLLTFVGVLAYLNWGTAVSSLVLYLWKYFFVFAILVVRLTQTAFKTKFLNEFFIMFMFYGLL